MPPIYPAAGTAAADPQQAADLLSGRLPGYVYSRDGHPNADLLAEKCRELHGAEKACVTATGMGALSAALLALLQVGRPRGGQQPALRPQPAAVHRGGSRLGITSSVVDACDPAAVAAAINDRTQDCWSWRRSPIRPRACRTSRCWHVAHDRSAWLLVDNTFAGPVVCRPLELGADLVMESLTKSMNGHSDVNLGLLCGRARSGNACRWCSPPGAWPPIRSIAGWPAAAGNLRLAGASEPARTRWSSRGICASSRRPWKRFIIPAWSSIRDHALAGRQFGERFGSMVTFTLEAGARRRSGSSAAVRRRFPSARRWATSARR